jgi:hypothetical protein
LDTNNVEDAYVFDRATDSIHRASVQTGGGQTLFPSYVASVSGDGQLTTFASTGPYVLDDTNGETDIYAHDTSTDGTTRVSVGSDGMQVDAASGNEWGKGSLDPSAPVSADGRFVAFPSSGQCTPDDPGPYFDIFVRGPLF